MNRVGVLHRRRDVGRALWLAIAVVLAFSLVLCVIGAILLHSALSRRPRESTTAPVERDAGVVRERNAETLFRSAQAAVKAGNWRLAHDELTRLKEDWSHTRFYAAHRAEVEALAKTIENAPAVKALLSPPPPPAPEPEPLPRTEEEVIALLKKKNPDLVLKGNRYVRFSGNRAHSVILPGCGLRDLSPLKGLPLDLLVCNDDQIADLSPLEGMPLKDLRCFGNRIRSLAPLRGAPLVVLFCQRNLITDLSPLAGMPLRALDCSDNRIRSLEPLRGLPLSTLRCRNNPVSELRGLEGMPLSELDCSGTRITDVSGLKGMRLTKLDLRGLAIRDLAPLLDVEIRQLVLSPDKAQGDLSVLRAHKTLRVIGTPVDDQVRRFAAWSFWLARDLRAGRVTTEPANPDDRWRRQIAETMQRKVTFDFVETPMQDVANFLSSLVDVTLVLDPKTAGRIPTLTLRVEEMPLGGALKQIAEKLKLTVTPRDSALFITTEALAKEAFPPDEAKQRFQGPPREEQDAWLAMFQSVTFDFVETPTPDVINFLAELTGLCLVLDTTAIKDIQDVTLRVNDMELRFTLAWVCLRAGLAYAWRDGAMFLSTPERIKAALAEDEVLRAAQKPPTKELAEKFAHKKMTFDFVETPLQDCINFLSSVVDVTIVADPKFMKGVHDVTLRVNEMRLDHSLRCLCRAAGGAVVWRDGVLFVSTPERIKAGLAEDEALRPAQEPPMRELAARLAEKVSFDFVETPCKDVVTFLADLTKLPLILDTEAVKAPPKLTLRVFEMPAGRAIRWCCRLTDLACLWRDGKLVITTPQRALEEAEKRKGQ